MIKYLICKSGCEKKKVPVKLCLTQRLLSELCALLDIEKQKHLPHKPLTLFHTIHSLISDSVPPIPQYRYRYRYLADDLYRYRYRHCSDSHTDTDTRYSHKEYTWYQYWYHTDTRAHTDTDTRQRFIPILESILIPIPGIGGTLICINDTSQVLKKGVSS